MTRRILTHARLKEVLTYDPRTGIFRWTVAVKWMVKPNDIAGHINTSNGRRSIKIKVDDVEQSASRLAFLYMTGRFPSFDVDHIDGNPLNNAWENLRDVTTSVNMHNEKKARRNNKLGVLGVTKHGAQFQAHIHFDGKKHTIGSFSTPELAYAAYIEQKRKHHAGCTI